MANLPNSAQLGASPTTPPSYIRVRAIVWACGRGQTGRHTDRHTHRRAWPRYISRRLRLTRNVTRRHRATDTIKCEYTGSWQWRVSSYYVYASCFPATIWDKLREMFATVTPLSKIVTIRTVSETDWFSFIRITRHIFTTLLHTVRRVAPQHRDYTLLYVILCYLHL